MQKYQFKKPEIVSIQGVAWGTVKNNRLFWVIVVGAFFATLSYIISDLGLLFLFPALIYMSVVCAIAFQKAKSAFWKQFAEINGWQYKDSGNIKHESGVMFKQGGSRVISHVIDGVVNTRQFRIFSYEFRIGSEESERIYYYTVFAFKFNGLFPHIYLDNKSNPWSISTGEKVSIPSEFEKKFSLSAPRKYETEALEIFTPDILVNLLDNGFPHDVEFVNQEVLIFTSGQINSFEQLEKEFNRALEIEDLLDEKLDKFKFEKIGDMPHTLK